MQRPVYLDYNATTPLDPRVFEAMRPYYQELFANPGSRTHLYGQHAREAVEHARGQVADLLRVRADDGVWGLEVETPGEVRTLRYDDAHRALFGVLGWNALPSPADRVFAAPGGYHAEGVGLGHRVGLCLGGKDAPLALLAAPPEGGAEAPGPRAW